METLWILREAILASASAGLAVYLVAVFLNRGDWE
jgi:hypothetical protein